MTVIGGCFLAAMLALSLLSRWSGDRAVWFLTFILVVLLAVAVAFFPKGIRRRRLLAVCGAFLTACICWMGHPDYDFSSWSGQEISLVGQVREIRTTTSGTRLALTVRVKDCSIPNCPENFGAIVYAPLETDVDFGDQVQVQGKCLNMGATPDFDLGDYYRGEGIYLTLSVYQPPQVESPDRKPFFYWFKAFNRSLCQKTDRIFAQPYSGLIRAVLLGDTTALDPYLYNRFTRAGITHIFVVSGMHVSLAAGAILLFLRYTSIPPQIQAVLGCAAAWAFAALSGFGISAIRAGIMITVAQSGHLVRRPAESLNSLCLAGALIVFFSPSAIQSGSFQLTMTATMGVCLFTSPISNWIQNLVRREQQRIIKPLADTLACSFGANLGMFPVIWKLFRGISIVFPISNLIAVPLLPVILITSALALLTEPIPFLSAPLTWMTQAALWLLCETAKLLTLGHGAYLGLDKPIVGFWMIAGILLLLAAWILWKSKAMEGKLLLILMILLAGTLVLSDLLEQDLIEIAPVYSFNGASVILMQGRRAAVFALEDDGRVDQTVEDRLRRKNVHTVQDLILNYGDPADLRDTAFLAEALNLGRIYAPREAAFGPYLEEYLHPEAGSYPMSEKVGYELPAPRGGGRLEAYREDGETILLLERGETRIGITRSARLAGKFGCDVLIYAGRDLEELRQVPLKYVLLLYEPEEDFFLPENVVPAWKESVCLRVDSEGRIQLRRN